MKIVFAFLTFCVATVFFIYALEGVDRVRMPVIFMPVYYALGNLGFSLFMGLCLGGLVYFITDD